MKIFDFELYSMISQFDSGWSYLHPSGINEGIRIETLDPLALPEDYEKRYKVTVDFENDLQGDNVLLKNLRKTEMTRKEKIPVYKGYVYESNSPQLDIFRKRVKTWGAFDKNTLNSLIDFTYPQRLKDEKVAVIFIAGSSEPLASLIAESLVELYYPNAKIVDVLKKYYGNDVRDIVDWDLYAQRDPRTRQMVDAYLRGFSYRGDLRNTPRNKFEGYIKKSTGAQGGMRNTLKAGHVIDDYIISSVIDARNAWKEKYFNSSRHSDAIAVKMMPHFLFVDDIIIEGSTMKGIFRELTKVFASYRLERELGSEFKKSLGIHFSGYCLFSKTA